MKRIYFKDDVQKMKTFYCLAFDHIG